MSPSHTVGLEQGENLLTYYADEGLHPTRWQTIEIMQEKSTHGGIDYEGDSFWRD
ncbi:MAG: hypothetical protein ACO2O3_15265 [Thermocrinis sp.]